MTKRLFAYQHRKLKYKPNYNGFAPGRSFREWVSHLTTLRRGRQWKPAQAANGKAAPFGAAGGVCTTTP